MIPQFSLNILFKHDQENLPGLMEALGEWCEVHQDTEIQFFDLGSNDDSRMIIEKWATAGEVRVAVKVVDIMDFSHFSQAVGLALRLSVGQVAWVGTPEDFPKPEELEKIFGRWNEGAELIWGFKPQSMSSGMFDPLLRQVEKYYPESFADQFFEQGRGAFIVADRKVMITHNAMLTATSSWWRHVVTSGWSMERWTLRNPILSATRINAPNIRLLEVVTLWFNQGSQPLQRLMIGYFALGAVSAFFAFTALILGMAGVQIHALMNAMVALTAIGFTVQFCSTGFVLLYLARRWDRSQILEKPLRYQENSLLSASPASLRGHQAIPFREEQSEATVVNRPVATVTPITQSSKAKAAAALAQSDAVVLAPVETEEIAEATSIASIASIVKEKPVVAEETAPEMAPTQVYMMEIKSKSS